MKHTVLSACLLLAVAPAAQQFRPERFAPVPARVAGWPTLDIEVGDVNRDGIDDVLIALDYGGVACLHADGNGGFIDRTTAVLTPAYASAWGVSLGDIDRDGDLDLAVAHDHEDRPQICLNQGDGTFVDVSAAAPSLGDVLQVVQWIDLDGDGA